MGLREINFESGDSVIVKQGTKEPDLEEFEIGGWQGRIVEVDNKSDKDNILITIEWDSLTLNQIPSDYIAYSEREGLDWQTMVLYDSELEKAKPRDKEETVKQTQEQLSDKHYWDSLDDAGIRISKILDMINPHDEMQSLQKWIEYLSNSLTFPVQAIISESEGNRMVKSGDKVKITSLSHIMDMYGIIATIRLNREKYEFPLCDLEVIDKTKADYQLIDDYRTWFANR